jgi:tRNA (guanine26-N2/guanine27-N2)-dimethyltransferase
VHDRRAALRGLGASARAHPASWELALRLQIAVVARCAWAMGRGVEPLLSFSEGRTFRTAVRLSRSPAPRQEEALGMLAHCHGCGDQQVQGLLRLRRWRPCLCADRLAERGSGGNLSISGPLWIGPLQNPGTLAAMANTAEEQPASLSREGRRLLERLACDPGVPARCFDTATIARRLVQGPPPLRELIEVLRQRGFQAGGSAIKPGQLRSDAPWADILEAALALRPDGQREISQGAGEPEAPERLLNR